MEIDDNDFKQLLGLLQQLVQKTASTTNSTADDEPDEDDEDVSPKPKGRKRIADNTKPRKKKRKFVNKFLQMREASMHKEDTEIDKKLSKVPPTQRSRQFEYVQVRCRVCGKEEKVIPALAEARDRYKCNKCSTSPG